MGELGLQSWTHSLCDLGLVSYPWVRVIVREHQKPHLHLVSAKRPRSDQSRGGRVSVAAAARGLCEQGTSYL